MQLKIEASKQKFEKIFVYFFGKNVSARGKISLSTDFDI